MGAGEGVGLKAYYKSKIEELELRVKDRTHNLRRLEAQRNELNTQGMQLTSCQQLHSKAGGSGVVFSLFPVCLGACSPPPS
jgi:26S proteasome regulatory subunit T6